MKNAPPKNTPDIDPVSADSTSADPVDEIVEDLTQQDVLPSVSGSLDEPEEPIVGGIDETGRWDEPIGERGHRAHRNPLDDETNYAELLVNDGLDEADEELRDLDEDDEAEESDGANVS
ncbi:hypothetical protein FEM03_02435 [Phragmitibacter flavus]|uniref:DUF5709 domain-containing protein n=1 Tax=Phragmitibacter flavus TaxID=2576071 RepID=A0A5R8KIU7_9BACT|nr:hypothetical protein [Phragmitibacter flavus]TLD72234.1 hypothetical protein FEM03_02435 [Phragmitibacter flavus]